MADETRNQDKPVYMNEQNQDVAKNDKNGELNNVVPIGASVPLERNNADYDQVSGIVTADRAAANEETAAEIAAPVNLGRDRQMADDTAETDEKAGGGVMGISALAVSIISLFVLPIVLGITGVVLGFIARGRGARGLANWAIGIGALSVIIGMFILPFY